jgi:superfamily II DNA helicase RecQ
MEKDQALVTIVLSPLRSLIVDQVKNINSSWPNLATQFSSKILIGTVRPPPLVFMHYNDYYDGSDAADWIAQLGSSGGIARVIFDEAQTLILWNEFTKFKQKLPLIRTHSFPLIFLSGSASTAVLDEVMELFSLPRPRYIFDSAPRKNLKYKVSQESDYDIFVQARIEERIIVFVSTKTLVNQTAKMLQNKLGGEDKLTTYHGDMSPEEKDENQRKWIETDGCLMVATLAFALGIDYPHVRYVYVLGSAYGLDNLIQMFGRAGRDGEKSFCCYYFKNNYLAKSDSRERRLLSDLQENLQCVR